MRAGRCASRRESESRGLRSASHPSAISTKLPRAEIVFDKFHVLQHGSRAIDEVRRNEFFRAEAILHEHGRGKHWLLPTPPRPVSPTSSTAGSLRWQRLPEMQKRGAFLRRHRDGTVASCRHPVRFGVVEGLNTTIKGILRRARGMRDEQLLLLKLKWATANPVGAATDLTRFLSQDLHSNR